jgi:hypothetical protein
MVAPGSQQSMPAVRPRFHLMPCSKIRSHLCLFVALFTIPLLLNHMLTAIRVTQLQQSLKAETVKLNEQMEKLLHKADLHSEGLATMLLSPDNCDDIKISHVDRAERRCPDPRWMAAVI